MHENMRELLHSNKYLTPLISQRGKTALMRAAYIGCTGIVIMLLEWGADAYATDKVRKERPKTDDKAGRASAGG